MIVGLLWLATIVRAGPPLHITPTNPAPTGDPAFYEDFSAPALDCNRWRVAQQAFRGDGNSLIRGDVEIQNGCLVLHANGDLYAGPLRGVNQDGSQRSDGKRTGGGIATEQYFGSGRYEMRVKMANVPGVASSFFTLNYQEYYPGDPQYKPPGSYYAVDQRSELGVYGTASAYCFASTGERPNELTQLNLTLPQPQNDGQFHVYRFDWNTGTDGNARKIDYYADGVLQRTITSHVPPSRAASGSPGGSTVRPARRISTARRC